MTPIRLPRHRDSDALRACLRRLSREVDVQVIFGGLPFDGEPVLTELVGNVTQGIRDVRIKPKLGLGGRVMLEARPRVVEDYRTAHSITHDYDGVVLTEGITSLLAIPVIVFGDFHGLVYLGTRGEARVGERAVAAAAPIVAALQNEIRVRCEVDRRVAAAETWSAHRDPRELSSLREVCAELRSIAATAGDPVLVKRLRSLGERLTPVPAGKGVLTPREIDVLSLVALGCRNAEIATRLCLSVETVRSYLRHAMQSLDARTRTAALLEARRRGEML